MSNRIQSQHTTKEQNDIQELYIYGKYRGGIPERLRNYKFFLLAGWDRFHDYSKMNKSAKELVPKLYKNYVVTISLRFSVYDFERQHNLFNIGAEACFYEKPGNFEKMSRFIAREKRDDLIWICTTGINRNEMQTIIVLQERLDIDLLNEIFKVCDGSGDDILVRFYADSKIDYKENKFKTAENYYFNRDDYIFQISISKKMYGVDIWLDNKHINFEQLIEAVAPVFESNGYCFANKVDPYPPDFSGLTEEQTEKIIREWEQARRDKKMHNPRTIYSVKQREARYAKMEKKAKEKAAAKKAKEEYRKANPIKDVVLNPFKQVGKDISGWFDSFYKK